MINLFGKKAEIFKQKIILSVSLQMLHLFIQTGQERSQFFIRKNWSSRSHIATIYLNLNHCQVPSDYEQLLIIHLQHWINNKLKLVVSNQKVKRTIRYETSNVQFVPPPPLKQPPSPSESNPRGLTTNIITKTTKTFISG